MQPVSEDDYRNFCWPEISGLVENILAQDPSTTFVFSSEQPYRIVYNCCVQRFQERLFLDLKVLIQNYFAKAVLPDLINCEPPKFLTLFGRYFLQYTKALEAICPVFGYLDRMYIKAKFHTSLQSLLMAEFQNNIVDHPSITPLLFRRLEETTTSPFSVDPETCMLIVKGLYSMNTDYPFLHPECTELFARYIPCLRPANERDHELYIAETHYSIQQMCATEDSAGTHGGRKRSADDTIINDRSSFSNSHHASREAIRREHRRSSESTTQGDGDVTMRIHFSDYV
eukprot:Nk52_evm63s266 gene=Nk52_evmTU63s266